jgi:hypothetical protein
MKRYVQSVLILVTLMFAAETFGQDEEPQLEEHLHHERQESAHAPQRCAAILDRAFHGMYDLDFKAADLELSQFSAECPADPLGPAAQAASVLFSIFEQHQILQSEFLVSNDRFTNRRTIEPNQAMLRRFESAMNRSEGLAMQSLARNKSDESALFALTLVYGLRADYAALVEHRDMVALRFSDKGNEWARQLLASSPHSYDAYVATGIQKYLVGLKPAPLRWMLRLKGIRGDPDQGILELQLAADKGHYLAPFARILLAIAHLRKDEQKEAAEILADLRHQFPGNPLFAEELARIARSNAVPFPQTSNLCTGSMRGTSCEAQ